MGKFKKPSWSGFIDSFKFGKGIWDPTHRFETSWLLPPWILFGVRAAFSLYAFTTLLFIIGWEATDHDTYSIHDVHKSFSYFTVLCYWGIAFYFLVAAIHTYTYALSGGTPLLNRFPRPLQALHHFFHTTITTYPFLVTIVYWSILYAPFATTFALWSNTSQHGLNSFFALCELLLTRINPPPWIHLFWLIVLLACYCGLAYVTWATKHYYVYPFLDPDARHVVNGVNEGGVGKGGVVGYVFGIAAAIVVIFVVVKGVATARKWITEKKLGLEGRFFGGRRLGSGEVDLETARVWEK